MKKTTEKWEDAVARWEMNKGEWEKDLADAKDTLRREAKAEKMGVEETKVRKLNDEDRIEKLLYMHRNRELTQKEIETAIGNHKQFEVNAALRNIVQRGKATRKRQSRSRKDGAPYRYKWAK